MERPWFGCRWVATLSLTRTPALRRISPVAPLSASPSTPAVPTAPRPWEGSPSDRRQMGPALPNALISHDVEKRPTTAKSSRFYPFLRVKIGAVEYETGHCSCGAGSGRGESRPLHASAKPTKRSPTSPRCPGDRSERRLTLVRTYILGDRWQGGVKISGNSVQSSPTQASAAMAPRP